MSIRRRKPAHADSSTATPTVRTHHPTDDEDYVLKSVVDAELNQSEDVEDGEDVVGTQLQQKNMVLFDTKVSKALSEMQQFLQITICESFGKLISLSGCELQRNPNAPIREGGNCSATHTEHFHEQSIDEFKELLDSRAAAIIQHVEMQFGVARGGAPPTSLNTSLLSDSSVSVAVELPSLRELQDASQKYAHMPTYAVPINHILECFKSNLVRFSEAWSARKRMHHQVNAMYQAGMRHVAQLVLNTLCGHVCKAVRQHIDASKAEEYTHHKAYQKPHKQMLAERKQLFREVNEFAQPQIQACRDMLTLVYQLICEYQQQASIDEPNTLIQKRRGIRTAHRTEDLLNVAETTHFLQPSPYYPMFNSPLNILELNSQDFYGLRPNNSMQFQHLLQQHELLKQLLDLWCASVERFESNDPTCAQLGDLTAKLILWVELLQALMTDVVAGLSFTNREEALSMSLSKPSTHIDNVAQPIPRVIARDAIDHARTQHQRARIRTFQDNLDDEGSESTSTSQRESRARMSRSRTTPVRRLSNEKTIASATSHEASTEPENTSSLPVAQIAQIKAFLGLRLASVQKQYNKTEEEFSDAQTRYTQLQPRIRELKEQRDKSSAKETRGRTQNSESESESASDGDDDEDIGFTSVGSLPRPPSPYRYDDETSTSATRKTETGEEEEEEEYPIESPHQSISAEVLNERYRIQESIKQLESSSEHLRIKFEQLRPLVARYLRQYQSVNRVIEFVNSFHSVSLRRWKELSDHEINKIAHWSRIRNDYHGYLLKRSVMVATVDTIVYEAIDNLRLQIREEFVRMATEHLKLRMDTCDMFHEITVLMSRTNSLVRQWHTEVAQGLPSVSSSILDFTRALDALVAKQDRTDALDYMTCMNKMVHMFASSMQHLPKKMTTHVEMLACLKRMGDCCWRENQAGFLHPYREPLSRKPNILISGTAIDRATYNLQMARPTQDVGTQDWKVRKQNAQVLGALAESAEKAQNHAMQGNTVGMDANVYLQSTLTSAPFSSLNMPPLQALAEARVRHKKSTAREMD